MKKIILIISLLAISGVVIADDCGGSCTAYGSYNVAVSNITSANIAINASVSGINQSASVFGGSTVLSTAVAGVGLEGSISPLTGTAVTTVETSGVATSFVGGNTAGGGVIGGNGQATSIADATAYLDVSLSGNNCPTGTGYGFLSSSAAHNITATAAAGPGSPASPVITGATIGALSGNTSVAHINVSEYEANMEVIVGYEYDGEEIINEMQTLDVGGIIDTKYVNSSGTAAVESAQVMMPGYDYHQVHSTAYGSAGSAGDAYLQYEGNISEYEHTRLTDY